MSERQIRRLFAASLGTGACVTLYSTFSSLGLLPALPLAGLSPMTALLLSGLSLFVLPGLALRYCLKRGIQDMRNSIYQNNEHFSEN